MFLKYLIIQNLFSKLALFASSSGILMKVNTTQPVRGSTWDLNPLREKCDSGEQWDSWTFPLILAVNIPLPVEHLEPFYALLSSADLEVQQMSSLSLVNFLLEGNSE